MNGNPQFLSSSQIRGMPASRIASRRLTPRTSSRSLRRGGRSGPSQPYNPSRCTCLPQSHRYSESGHGPIFEERVPAVGGRHMLYLAADHVGAWSRHWEKSRSVQGLLYTNPHGLPFPFTGPPTRWLGVFAFFGVLSLAERSFPVGWSSPRMFQRALES